MNGLMLNVLIAEKMQKENQILCQDGLEVAGIGLDIWMHIMINSLYHQKKSNIGRMWMFM
jgi:hypothetical protein